MRFRAIATVVVLCSSLCLTVWSSYAQPDTAIHISVGVHAEYGFSNLRVRPYTPTHGGARWGTGLSIRLDNSKIFGMNAELNYTLTEYRVEESTPRPFNNKVDFTPGEQKARMRWVEVPLIAEIGYQFPMWRVFALGGGYADYLVSERFGSKGVMPKQKLLLTTHYRFGGGLIGGAGVGLVTRYGALIFEYRAAIRLVSLYKRTLEGGLESPNETLTSQSFGLTYYYTFTVRKKEKKSS